MTGLQVRDVTVVYPGEPPVTAVDHANLDAAVGEVVGLLGPSGCGKSSLLGAIAGIVACTGTVRWDGAEVTHTPVHQRGFGLVFQDGQLFPHRTVAGNISFGLQMARRSRHEQQERVSQMLELVGLAGFASRQISELSGGERQRVALARSLAPAPRLLLLDEPLSSLDRALRDRLAAEMRAILVTTGTTAIVVTHDRAEAGAMCDRVIKMRAGHVL